MEQGIWLLVPLWSSAMECATLYPPNPPPSHPSHSAGGEIRPSGFRKRDLTYIHPAAT